MTFLLRRPHLYGAYTDEANLKPLDHAEPIAAPGQTITPAGLPPGGR